MVIARLHDGEINPTPDSLKTLLYSHILGRDKEGKNEDLENAHPDPFLRSMASWIHKDYAQSLATLVEPNVGQLHPKYSHGDELFPKRSVEADPSVFNFYIYLRTHPLIARQQLAKKRKEGDHLSGFRGNSIEVPDSGTVTRLSTEDAVTPLERKLYFSTAHFHLRYI